VRSFLQNDRLHKIIYTLNDIATNNALGKSYISDNHQTTLLFSLTGQDLLPESIQ